MAISSQEFVFPENAALPIGGENKIHKQVLLEIHYDNPDELSGQQPQLATIMYIVSHTFHLSDIIDSSGFRLYYTDKPKEHDAGVLLIGQIVVPHLIIPPRVDKFTVKGFCFAKCTDAVRYFTS